MRRDTPDNTGKTPDQRPRRLNNKLGYGSPAEIGIFRLHHGPEPGEQLTLAPGASGQAGRTGHRT